MIKGKYVVGCTDIMIGGPNKEDGCFLRMYYPSQIKDTYVSGLIYHNTP